MQPENLSRTVRFKRAEIELIEEFLEKNSFLDFSTLTRIAVLEFIQKPTLQIRPVITRQRELKVRRGKEMQ